MNKFTPGPWAIEQYSASESYDGYKAGFYVCRQVGQHTAWLRDTRGRARRFMNRQTAEAAIAKAEGR